MRKELIPVFLVLTLAGCAANEPHLLPVHNEVIIAPVALDLAYLRTLEAVQAHPDWELDYTIKEKGIIYLRNLRYSSFSDADQRRATILVKRVGPRQTSIQFAKESQSVVGGDQILNLIKRYLPLEASQSQAS